jgi:hypothetical protein
MRNYIFIALLLSLFSEIIYSQTSETIVSIGDQFLISNAYPNSYKHINFPKANLIIKRGGIFNYNSIKGAKVVVTELKKKKNDLWIATIKLVNGKLFFNSHHYLTVEIYEAIKQKELIKV